MEKRIKPISIILPAFFCALIIAGTFIRIPIPIIPFTLQLSFVTLAGLVLGKKLGSLSVLAYIILGLIGVPVFTQGGGLAYIFKPSFGYIIGFLFGAYVCGLLIEKNKNKSYWDYFFAGLVSIFIIYFVGVVYFYLISIFYLKTSVTVHTLLISCFLITFIPDFILNFLVAFVSFRLKNLKRDDI